MKAAPFTYVAARTAADAVALLAEHGDDAKVIAGGQSLVPLLQMRLVRPAVLIDIGAVRELAYIREAPDGVAIGATTRHRDVERSPLVRRACPLLAEAVAHVGHVAIRHRGTIGGSLAHADPAAEAPAAVLAVDAGLTVLGPGGERTVAAGDFFLSYFTTCLGAGEILTGVSVPRMDAASGYAFLEVTRRHGDFALVGVAAVLAPGPAGTVASARLALTGVGAVPVRCRGAERALAGRPAGAAAFEAAAAAAREEIEPEGDVHASADYRRHVAGVLVERALARAWARAGR